MYRLSDCLIDPGGDFTLIGGQLRNHIAALDVTTGLLTAWNPDASGRASPLMVAIYQLKSIEKFQNDDFFSVFDPRGAAGWDPQARPAPRLSVQSVKGLATVAANGRGAANGRSSDNRRGAGNRCGAGRGRGAAAAVSLWRFA